MKGVVSINWLKRMIPVTLVLALLFSTTALVGASTVDVDPESGNKLRTNVQERLRLDCPGDSDLRQERLGMRAQSALPDDILTQLQELRQQRIDGTLTCEALREQVRDLLPQDFNFKARNMEQARDKDFTRQKKNEQIREHKQVG